jgi:hypothetical protein
MTTNFIRSLGFTIVLAIGIPALITFQGQFAKADETPTTLSADATEVQPIGDVWNRTELYFGMSNANENIEAIRNEYEKAFNQESVLRVDSLERVSF